METIDITIMSSHFADTTLPHPQVEDPCYLETVDDLLDGLDSLIEQVLANLSKATGTTKEHLQEEIDQLSDEESSEEENEESEEESEEREEGSEDTSEDESPGTSPDEAYEESSRIQATTSTIPIIQDHQSQEQCGMEKKFQEAFFVDRRWHPRLVVSTSRVNCSTVA
jgi:hypothetical protein